VLLQGAQLASCEAIFQGWPALKEKNSWPRRKKMNVEILLAALLLVAAAVACLVIFVITRRAAAPAAPARRTIRQAVGAAHDDLDGCIIRTVDEIGRALAAAVPASVFVGAASAAPPAGAAPAPAGAAPGLAGATAAVEAAIAALTTARAAMVAAAGQPPLR